MSRNIIDELNEKIEELEHEKRALANRCYVLTRGLCCNSCAVDGCRYKAKEQKENKSC